MFFQSAKNAGQWSLGTRLAQNNMKSGSLGPHVPQVHQRRKFDSRCLLNQTAPIAVNITGGATEDVCVAVRDRLAAKRLLQTEVQASKTTRTYRYT